jgi:Na+/H+-dicarboxylate symporter
VKINERSKCVKKIRLSTKILIGLILGVGVGWILSLTGGKSIAEDIIKPFGTLFLNLIKMIIVPLVFSSLVIGSASVGDVKKLGRIGVKTMVYYLLTTAGAVILGLILGNIIAPGANVNLGEAAKQSAEIPKAPGIAEVLLGIIPTNPVKAFVDGNMLQIIFFAIFVGIAITFVGKKAEGVKKFFDEFAEIMYKITGIVMAYAPIGVFALIVPVVTAYGASVLMPLFKVIIAVYVGCILHAAIVYSSCVWGFAKMSPWKFFKGIFPAQVIAFTTCSSSGTLPATMKCTEENLGVSKQVSSFVLPLGATVNMDGTALYQGVCALFVAQFFGIELSLAQQAMIVLTATLASIGTAGVPGAGLLMLTMVLQQANLPIEGIALIAGIDRILDMIRTTINITGDASAAVIVAHSEGDLDVPKPIISVEEPDSSKDDAEEKE